MVIVCPSSCQDIGFEQTKAGAELVMVTRMLLPLAVPVEDLDIEGGIELCFDVVRRVCEGIGTGFGVLDVAEIQGAVRAVQADVGTVEEIAGVTQPRDGLQQAGI